MLALSEGEDLRSEDRVHDETAMQSALHLWTVLSRARASVAAREERDLVRHKLRPAEFRALNALFFDGPLLIGDIRRTLLLSSGGTTYLIDRLAKSGFVRRIRSTTDRRTVLVALTAEGERFFVEIFGGYARGLVKSLSALDLREQARAIRLLEKMSTGPDSRTGFEAEVYCFKNPVVWPCTGLRVGVQEDPGVHSGQG